MTAHRTEVRHGVGFWLGVAVGWAVMGFGIWGVFNDSNQTHPDSLARWFFGGLLVHDLLLAPVVVVVGVALARLAPKAVRPALTAALMVGGAVTLYSTPLLLGYGDRPANPSALPNDYVAGLAWVLGAVAIIAIGAVLGGRWRTRNR